MKNTLLLFTLITFILSCEQKSKEEQVLVTHIEQNLQKEEEKPESNTNKSKQPNWAYDPYGYLTYELDSLGLKYETISNEIFQSRYKERDWVYLKNSEITQFYISSDTILNIDTFRFEIDFNEKMNYNENAGGFYGGIAKMRVIKNGKHIQTLKNIEDATALGIIRFSFYDYNFDGYLDIQIPLNDNYPQYYIFNSKEKQFELVKEWNYIKPYLFNKSKKQFKTSPDGTASVGSFNLFQINGNVLEKLKTFHYHPINEKEGSFITIVNHN